MVLMFGFFVRVCMWFACAYMDKMLSSQWTHGMMVMKTLNEHLKLCLHEQTCAWDVASCLIIICWTIYQLFKHQTAVPPNNLHMHVLENLIDWYSQSNAISKTNCFVFYTCCFEILFWPCLSGVFFSSLKMFGWYIYPHQTLLSINNLLLTCRYHVISQVACYRGNGSSHIETLQKWRLLAVRCDLVAKQPRGPACIRCRSGSAETGNQTHL